MPQRGRLARHLSKAPHRVSVRGPSAPARLPGAAAPTVNARLDAPPVTAQTDPPPTDPPAAAARGREGMPSASVVYFFLQGPLLLHPHVPGSAAPAPRGRVRRRAPSAAGATPPRVRARVSTGTLEGIDVFLATLLHCLRVNPVAGAVRRVGAVGSGSRNLSRKAGDAQRKDVVRRRSPHAGASEGMLRVVTVRPQHQPRVFPRAARRDLQLAPQSVRDDTAAVEAPSLVVECQVEANLKAFARSRGHRQGGTGCGPRCHVRTIPSFPVFQRHLNPTLPASPLLV